MRNYTFFKVFLILCLFYLLRVNPNSPNCLPMLTTLFFYPSIYSNFIARILAVRYNKNIGKLEFAILDIPPMEHVNSGAIEFPLNRFKLFPHFRIMNEMDKLVY